MSPPSASYPLYSAYFFNKARGSSSPSAEPDDVSLIIQYECGRNMLKFILVIHGLILIYVYGKVSFMDRGFFNRAVLGNSEKVLP